jgi:hypothetical protein
MRSLLGVTQPTNPWPVDLNPRRKIDNKGRGAQENQGRNCQF